MFRPRLICSALALCAITLASTSAWAQSVIIRSNPLRFTVPHGVAGSSLITNTIVTSGLTSGVTFALTGVPAGVTATFSTNTITVNGTHTATLSLSYPNNLAVGEYDLAIEATGDTSYRLPVPVQVAYFWSGIDYTNNVSTNWTSTGNWLGGVVPGPTDPVVFKDIGGSTAAVTTNIVVASDATVASIRFSTETGTRRFNTMEILSGAKLSVTGPGLSFSMHRDTKIAASAMDAKISGGGTLEVINPAAQIGLLVDQQQNTTFDMRDLNNFIADVSRIGFGNHRLWPNFYTNGYVGEGTTAASSLPFRFVPLVWLAKTNVIKCSWTDPNNYNDSGLRDYALEIGNDTAAGTTANIRFSMGLSNAFFLDSICWAHAGKGGSGNTFNFNAANSYALFRGIGGGRMSIWAQGDASGVALSGSNVRGTTVDFSNGQVDALIDRLILTRGRTNSSGFTIQGTLTIGGVYLGSIFDVNTAILGNQDVNNLNTGTVASVANSPIGTLNVNSNATFKVNGTLHLGYTTAASPGSPNYPENCSGLLNINNSGIVMASNILAGGVSKLSTANSISVNNNGKLIVTNKLGASDSPINLTLANGAQLTLHSVATGQTAVYARTFSAATACTISVPSIAGYVSGTVTIPLISYQTFGPNISGLTVIPPAGLFTLSVVDNGSGLINVTFGNRIPQTLVWRGNINSDWNTTDKNWVTQIGGIQTNFFDGDSVVFDDSVGAGPTTINIPSPVAPGQVFAPYGMVVSNANYTFDSGSLLGAATVRKTGTGTLTINANFSPGVIVNQGALAGSFAGVIGPTRLENGSTMTGFLGTINGGLTTSNATAVVSGTVNGGLNLQAGSLSNNGTINGNITVATNATVENALAGIINVTVPWTIPTNSTLINNGTINQSGSVGGNNGLTVNGALKGVGTIVIPTGSSADARVTIGPGGTLTIGNALNEITNITIATRLDFLAGSTTTFDVDNATAANDKILLTSGFIAGKVNFGNGNSLGGRFVVNKLTGPDFNLATSLSLFNPSGPNANVPDNANQALPGVVPAPAAGLTWDVSQMVTNLTLNVSAPPFMTNSITVGTNGVKSFVFEWPDAYRGWRLERQTNSLAVGLESPSTNWVSVANSFAGTNSLYYPDITNNPSAYWFRSSVAITDTNGAALAPATFFKLTYP